MIQDPGLVSRRVEALLDTTHDRIDDLVPGVGPLREQDCVGGGGHRGGHCQISRLPAHDFDDESPMMRAGGVGDVVTRLDDGIERAVHSQGLSGEPDVIVDRCRYADHRHVGLLAEDVCPGHRAVATDDDQPGDGVLLQLLNCGCPGTAVEEPRAAARPQDGPAFATFGFDLRHRGGETVAVGSDQRSELTVDQTVIAALDSPRRDFVGGSHLGDGADGRIHPGSVAA